MLFKKECYLDLFSAIFLNFLNLKFCRCNKYAFNKNCQYVVICKKVIITLPMQ